MNDGEPLRFKASFEVMPEIKVEGYKELRADKPEITVTDEEVEQSLNSLREQHATFTPVEGRPLADGDYAQVSLDGKPKEGGQASPSTWMKCWSRSAARTPCPSSPRICAELPPATSASSK